MKRAILVPAIAVLVVAAVGVYHHALYAYFFDDDFQWLVNASTFHHSQLVAFGSLSHFYRPVIDVYFAAATPLFGGSPVAFHLMSMALHACNVLIVFAFVRAFSHRDGYAFVAALLFAVQPSDIDAVAWVGAIAEAIGACFGVLSLLFFLEWRDQTRPRARTLSGIAFLLALLTHESSVVFLPTLVLADWATRQPAWVMKEWARQAPRAYGPYIVLTGAYLTIDLWINSHNYLISQGHYALGLHIFRNALDYLNALYIGKHDALNDAVITIGVALLLLRGSRRVRFATGWMLMALAPFLFFSWGNTSRYLYQPAIGFSMLLAEGIVYIDELIKRRVPTVARTAIVGVLVAGIAIRFAVFASANVASFAHRTEAYRVYLRDFRAIHGDVPSHTTVAPDPRLGRTLPYPFVNAAVQWHYQDPTIQITPYDDAR